MGKSGERRRQREGVSSVECRGAAYSGCSREFCLSEGVDSVVQMFSFFRQCENKFESPMWKESVRQKSNARLQLENHLLGCYMARGTWMGALRLLICTPCESGQSKVKAAKAKAKASELRLRTRNKRRGQQCRSKQRC